MLDFLKYKTQYDLDDPKATLSHRDIILQKPILKKIYVDWYNDIMSAAKTNVQGKILEIGSGGGFLKQLYPAVVTSDILPLETCEMTFSAEEIPFKENELSAIVMLNVFHHIPHPWKFLKEAERTLAKGGKIVMIEPANSSFGRFIYKRFHHEPFDEKGDWEIVSKGPLSDSNQALPYIYFERDVEKFKTEFPNLKINKVKYHSPLRYLLSGGVSMKALVPSWSYGIIKGIELLLNPFGKLFGMFVTIEVEKN